ncbi:MAG: hypothetical protein KC425_01210 [Anaerolineales bacterium]|nr:hypothetical protein [Anaerolineales bacterium]
MTSLLKKAFMQAEQLPEWEQDALAAFILEEIAASQQWNQQSSKPRKQAARSAARAEQFYRTTMKAVNGRS